MRVRQWVSAAALATTVVTAGAGFATADPAASADPEVHYRATNNGAAAVITIESGTMAVDNGVFAIKSASGRILAGIPLAYRIDDIAYPVAAAIDGNTATLTPTAMPFEDEAPWRTRYEREQAAFTRAAMQITTAAAGGAAVGTAMGGVVGCVGGAVVGTVVTGMLAALFGAGPLAGCLAGIALGAGIGAFAGALLVTAPVAIASVVQYFATINEPFTPPAPTGK